LARLSAHPLELLDWALAAELIDVLIELLGFLAERDADVDVEFLVQ
jgi:hypothetical protein